MNPKLLTAEEVLKITRNKQSRDEFTIAKIFAASRSGAAAQPQTCDLSTADIFGGFFAMAFTV